MAAAYTTRNDPIQIHPLHRKPDIGAPQRNLHGCPHLNNGSPPLAPPYLPPSSPHGVKHIVVSGVPKVEAAAVVLDLEHHQEYVIRCHDEKYLELLVYLGEQYVNNSTLSDVTFLVEGRRFYAHRIFLLASSDAFRAMFDGGYREKDVKDIEIPNIQWNVFQLMMRYIYTSSVNVSLDIAQDLLRAADQYLLEGLKRLCECTIAQVVSVENVTFMYEFLRHSMLCPYGILASCLSWSSLKI
ncbi:hypothetical protein KSS87_018208 [Heliosperma pusillum]|nr:hypothetical protein KSS87_018208 [Heliosperma pusillum]